MKDDSLVEAAIPVPSLARGLAATAHANRVIRVTWLGEVTDR